MNKHINAIVIVSFSFFMCVSGCTGKGSTSTSSSDSSTSSDTSSREEKFTVYWKNYDDSILEVDRDVPKGTTPSYDGPTPTREETSTKTYSFIGWDNKIVPVTSDITYKAQFEECSKLCLVSFDTNGGTPSTIPSQSVEYGKKASKPTDPSKSTYNFLGWYTDVLFTNLFDFDTPVTTNLSLYAGWQSNNAVIINSPSNKAVIDVRNDKVKDFVDHYSQAYSVKYYDGSESCINNPIVLSWSALAPFQYYVVRISLDENFSTFDSYLTLENSFSFINPMTNSTYYWQVTGYDSDAISNSGIYSFSVDIAPRFINVDGVSNMRDIGGYATSDGKHVKQGYFYRSATLDNITQKGITTATVDLGIKTELSLIGNTKKTVSILGEDVKYIDYACPWWVDSANNGIDNPAKAPDIKNVIEVFADPSNYPIDFHCSLGQDRTGTIAILILGLLGVSERDILMDYEYTQMSKAGYAASIPVPNKFQYQVNPTIAYLKTFNSNGSDFKNCVTTYLKTFVNVDQSTIDAIRTNLLEA